jgi:two-component sensor histidine kinase
MLCSLVTGTLSAQKAVFLAPQQHKLRYADSLHREAVKAKDTLMLAESYYLYGKIFEATGDNVTSLQWFLKSLRFLEPYGESPALSRLYRRLADMEVGKGRREEALRYAKSALAIALRVNSEINIQTSYNTFANIHLRDWSEEGKKPWLPAARPDSALHYYNVIEARAKKSGDSLMLAGVSMGKASFSLLFHRDTANYLRRVKFALDIYTKKHKDGDRIGTLLTLARFDISKEQYKTAWRYLKEASQIYDNSPINVAYLRNDLESVYSLYYSKTRRWRSAFEHSENLRRLQTTNYMAERDLAFQRLGKEYETEKKDALLHAKDVELRLRSSSLAAQKRLTFIVTVLLAGMAVMMWQLYKLALKNYRIGKQNEMLIREQNHRVKNNLQAISSLLSLQSETLLDAGALKAIEESRLRVETIAILHRRLYDSEQLGEVFVPDFLEELTEGVLATFGYENVFLTFCIDPFYLSADKAINLGLILNELLTNACKYAFPGHQNPLLTVSCTKSKRKDGQSIAMTVTDNGYAFAKERGATAGSPGFGMRLIQMMTEQLYAKYSFTFSKGTEFRMSFNQI